MGRCAPEALQADQEKGSIKVKNSAPDIQKVSSLELRKNLRTRIEELTALYDVSKTITSSMDLREMLKLIAHKVSGIMRAGLCVIHLIEDTKLVLRAQCGMTRDLSPMKITIPLDDNFFANAVSKRRPIVVKDLLQHSRHVFSALFRKRGFRSLLVVPLVEKEKVIGTLSVFHSKVNVYTKNDEEELGLFASQAAVAIDNSKLFQQTRQHYLNTMRLLASVIDAKDSYTEDHSEKVMRYALGISKELNLPESKRQVIKFASFLHDIGKINIDVSILRKTGPLNKQEWEKIIEHPRVGAEIIRRAGFLDDLIPAILYHHVKYSGGGYPPCNKHGTSIPIEARVLAVADAFEAMTSSRPYRVGMRKEKAIDELKRCSGTQFDPKVVKSFLRYLKKNSKV